ncbi:hypothetical protein HID58_091316 [Brassica napus]|uniref:Uncharacterized protein n=1 Tax=Brassica napus TaxID=3708 RepID=A0ABQ7X2V0_BRANA|nr:hypothetical protein HID58_091316 [Brassica napus]
MPHTGYSDYYGYPPPLSPASSSARTEASPSHQRTLTNWTMQLRRRLDENYGSQYGVYGIYSTVPSDNSSDYANHSVRVSAKFNNGFGEENKFNCLTILLADNVAFRPQSASHPSLEPFPQGISTSFQAI